MKLETALQLAGLAQLGLMIAGAVNLREHLQSLPPFIRRLFWIYYVFIGLCLLSFGLITLLHADELATAPLGRSLCAFLAVFWTIRLVAACFVFDVRPYLTNAVYRIGYQTTSVVFAFLPVVFAWAAIKGGAQ